MSRPAHRLSWAASILVVGVAVFGLALCTQAAFAQGHTRSSAESSKASPKSKAGTKEATRVTRRELRAVFDTSMGRMVCRLYPKRVPKTVANFVGLATGRKTWTDPKTHKKMVGKPLYNGTIFHRVIPGFMIQGGDPLGTGLGGPGYTFDDEIVSSLNFDIPGRLAMANSGPNTNGSQFFITLTPQPHLDRHYTIFGQCGPASILVARTIAQVPTNRQSRPLEPVHLTKVVILRPGQPLPPAPRPKRHGSSSGSHR